MARTESVSFQVHPSDEQRQIEMMQKFHWNLLSSNEVKTVDNKLERRGDAIYSVSKSEHYVKLAFSRELNLPNLKEIKQLESQFDALPHPQFPRLVPGPLWLWVVASLFYGAGVVCWLAYFFAYYNPRKSQATALAASNDRTRGEILAKVAQFDSDSDASSGEVHRGAQVRAS